MVDDIQDLHHMLFLAAGFWGNTADILEIDAPFLTGVVPLQGFMIHHWRAIDAVMFIQYLPDRACAAWQPIPLGLQVLISMQIIQDRLGSGCPF